MKLRASSLLAVLVLAVLTGASAAPALNINYTLPRPEQVSINVYDSSGQVVRELLHAAPRAKGANHETWDGLDERGKPTPTGRYSWKLLGTTGLHAEYLMTLGLNPNVPWAAWPGNHNGVHAIAIDTSGFYFAGGSSEGPPTIIKEGRDGKRLWEKPNFEAWQGGHSMAVDGGRVFMMQGNGKLQVLDAATGKLSATFDEIWQETDRGKEDQLVTGLKMDVAAAGGGLVMSHRAHDAVRWLDPANGKVVDEASVPEPLGIALAPNGTCYVISRNRVLALSRAVKTPRPNVTGLVDPWRLAVDAPSGDLFVVDRGTSQQVKRFSAEGRPLRVYGTPGGRPREGRYDPTGFADIAAITSDGAGGFMVAEPEISPRRTAHFDGEGKLLREWYGGQNYANFAAADPEDPSSVWLDSAWGEVIQARVDYAHKSWRVQSVYHLGGLAKGMIQTVRPGFWKVRHHGGNVYLVGNGWPCVLQVDEAHRRVIPRVAVRFTPNFWKPAEGWPPFLQELRVKFHKTEGDATGYFCWLDRNGDGEASVDEVTDEQLPVHWVGGDVGPDFTYYMYGCDGAGAANCGVHTLQVKEWLPNGTPVYDYAGMHMVMGIEPQFDRSQVGAMPDAEGNLFVAYTPQLRPNVHANRLGKWTSAGKLLWTVGRLAEATGAAPGEAKAFHHMVGVVHECAVVADYADSMVHVWDSDGLWVGRFYDHPDLKAAPAEAYGIGCENFAGSVYEEPATGDVIYYGGACNSSPTFRITGWNDWVRQHGALDLSAALAARLRQASDQRLLQAAPGASTIIRYVASIKADGDLSDWKGVTPLRIIDGKEVRALVYLCWNPGGLFAAFDVTTTAPWKTAAALPLAFQGAAVDVNLGPAEPARDKPMAGDYRVVAAPVDGTAHLMIMMPALAPGLADGYRHPQTYKTGLGETTCQRVEGLNDPVAAKVKPGGRGYIVEFRLPVYAPVALQSGARVRLDCSVILSNPQGNHSSARLSWHSRDPGDAMTQDVYTESLLRPAAWAQAVLE